MKPAPLAAGLGGLAALALCAAAAVAAADPPPPNATPANATPANAGTAHSSHAARLDKGNIVTCRDVAVTGSHISRKRVCKTNREWDDEADQTDQILETDRIIKGTFPH